MNHAEVLKGQLAEACAKEKTEFELRLENWIRWNKAGNGFIGHCFSAEHRYRPLRVKDSDGVSIPINEKDAYQFDRAYRHLATHLPIAAYIIKASYITHESPGKIARKAGCRLRYVLDRLAWSLKLLENYLHFLDKRV